MTAVLERSTARRRAVRVPLRRLLVLLVGVGLLAVIMWRSSLSPLEEVGGIWTLGRLPAGDSALVGMQDSRSPHFSGSVQILDVTAVASTHAVGIRFWSVPIPRNGDGAGGESTSQPPPGWAGRSPAAGSTLAANEGRQLVVQFAGRNAGPARIDGVRIRYRTPDGFVHVQTDDDFVAIIR